VAVRLSAQAFRLYYIRLRHMSAVATPPFIPSVAVNREENDMLLWIKKIFLVSSCMTFLVSPDKSLASELYGAIAVSPTTADWGISINYSSSTDAKKAALNDCGAKDCKVVIESQKCLTISGDSSGNSIVLGYSSASDIETAISGANKVVLSYGVDSPTTWASGCNGDKALYMNEPSQQSSQGYNASPSYIPSVSYPNPSSDPNSAESHWNWERCGDWSGC
jgi:Domain of unknown function (DUF4189)